MLRRLTILVLAARLAAEGAPVVIIEPAGEEAERPLPPAVRLLHGWAERLAEQAPVGVVNVQPVPWPLDPKAPKPGREKPAAPATPSAYRFSWDGYHSLVVVGEGAGLTRPAWVLTMEGATTRLAVSYRATAFRDAEGRLHIDARQAEVAGPKVGEAGNGWIPDSFCIAAGWVYTIDDTVERTDGRVHPGHTAALGQVVEPRVNPGEYRRLLAWAQGVVEGGL
jgi:hypothetical protein